MPFNSIDSDRRRLQICVLFYNFWFCGHFKTWFLQDRSLKNNYIPPTLTPESLWMQKQAFRSHGNTGSGEKNVFNSLSAGFFGYVIVGSVFESAAEF